MIDIERRVYTPISTTLKSEFPGIDVSGEYVRSPSVLPHVSVVEMDNYGSDYDTSDDEQYAVVTYEVNVYSNKATGRKTECREILQVIDKMMYGMNFRRLSTTPVPNMEDATIYRLTARYRAKTNGETIYKF